MLLASETLDVSSAGTQYVVVDLRDKHIGAKARRYAPSASVTMTELTGTVSVVVNLKCATDPSTPSVSVDNNMGVGTATAANQVRGGSWLYDNAPLTDVLVLELVVTGTPTSATVVAEIWS